MLGGLLSPGGFASGSPLCHRRFAPPLKNPVPGVCILTQIGHIFILLYMDLMAAPPEAQERQGKPK